MLPDYWCSQKVCNLDQYLRALAKFVAWLSPQEVHDLVDYLKSTPLMYDIDRALRKYVICSQVIKSPPLMAQH